MFAPFQKFLSGGAALKVGNSDCTSTTTLSPFTDVAHGDSQAPWSSEIRGCPLETRTSPWTISTSMRSKAGAPSATRQSSVQ